MTATLPVERDLGRERALFLFEGALLDLPLAHPAPSRLERSLGGVADALRRELGTHALGVSQGR